MIVKALITISLAWHHHQQESLKMIKVYKMIYKYVIDMIKYY